MSLKDIELKHEYRSFKNDIIKDFYIPILSKAKEYKRAVGFFSSTALIEISKGITALAKNGGKMKLLTSPILSEEDIEAMKIGYEKRKEIVSKRLVENLLDHQDSELDKKRLNLLANLIADGTLDIKVILLKGKNYGMYHEKMGIVIDEYNNKVVFSGSMNESLTAMKMNYEAIDVFTSWSDNIKRIDSKEKVFDEMWNNKHENMESIEIPNVKDEFIERYKTGPVNYDLNLEIEMEETDSKVNLEKWIKKPDYVDELYNFQKEAIDNWEIQDFKGIFDMATGTGKTLTALGGLSRLAERLDNKIGIIVICPYQHLVEQWVEDIKASDVNPLVCYSAYNWKEKFERQLRNFTMGITENFFVVTTNATFITDFFQNQIDKLKGNVCLVVDEAHNFGTKRQIKCMKNIYNYRLALSATLERHHDKEGTQKLYDFFGEKSIEYDLERAIAEEKLTKYFYHPIPIILTDEEFEEYEELSRKIGQALGGKDNLNDLPESVEMLLIKRARVIAGADNKIEALSKIIKEEYIDDTHMLIYCGAANVSYSIYKEGSPEDQEIRQIDAVLNKLGNELEMRVAKFTSEENHVERKQIRELFAEGSMLQALVAIRCLDEGVNIPSIKTAFILASSTNPKEYIQRRGRVLRLYEGKTHANIYDFIALPRNLDEYINTQNISNSEISLVEKEFVRVEEFARLAENSSDSYKLRERIKGAYNLDYISYGGS